MKARELVSRSFLYIGIALASLTTIALLVATSIYTGIKIFSGSWLALSVWTGFLFWWIVKSYKASWNRPSFWLATVALLCAHLPAWLLVLRKYPQWRPLWFIPFVFVEMVLFGAILDTTFKVKPTDD